MEFILGEVEGYRLTRYFFVFEVRDSPFDLTCRM